MADFSEGMKNPCEECLVKVVCTTACDDLCKFSRKVLEKDPNANSYRNWLKNYECRPAVLNLASTTTIKY